MRSLFLPLAALATVLLSGCAIVNPYVSANDRLVLDNPSMANAVNYAADTRQAYYDGIRDYTQFNRSAAVALIGTAAAAAALGIQGGNSTIVTELGLGGAGLFGVSRVLYSERRLRVYAAAAQTITCTLSAFAPMRSASDAELVEATRRLDELILQLKAKLAEVSSQTGVQSNSRVVFAKEVLLAAEATLVRARQATAALKGAGVRLYDAVEETRAAVNKALLQNEPDLAEIVASANSLVRTNAGLLTVEPEEPAGGGDETDIADPGQERIVAQLDELAKATEVARLRVEALLGDIGTAPTAEHLKACAIDPNEAGLSFRTEPRTTVIADPSSKDGLSTVDVSGGKPPYYASWVGPEPSALTLGTVEHTEGAAHGKFTIKTASTATVGSQYRVLVRDSGKGEATLTVLVAQGRKSGGKESGSGTSSTPKSGDDPRKRIQSQLIAMGCLKDPLPSGASAADGIWGSATRDALEAMVVATGTKVADFYAVTGEPTDPPTPKFLDQVAKAISAKATASTWKECKPSP